MFNSRRRELVFPQSEHARLAGHLACEWGNSAFERPGSGASAAVSFQSFCTGVALHDAGYGVIDADAIGEMSQEASRSRFLTLMTVTLEDRIAETIIKHHVLRLLRYTNFDDLAADCRHRIERLIDTTDVPAECFQRLDTLTDLCDSMAFHFCFEEAAEKRIDVSHDLSSTDSTTVHYRFSGDTELTVSPWPFTPDRICGYMLAYQRGHYPDTLRPVVVPYRVMPA